MHDLTLPRNESRGSRPIRMVSRKFILSSSASCIESLYFANPAPRQASSTSGRGPASDFEQANQKLEAVTTPRSGLRKFFTSIHTLGLYSGSRGNCPWKRAQLRQNVRTQTDWIHDQNKAQKSVVKS
jgi:hypothetical protein